MHDSISAELTKQDVECLEQFRLFETGAYDLILKSGIKKWEYVLHGGRKEFYPEDRKSILTLLGYSKKRQERDQRRTEKQQELAARRKGG
jgi:hypothetical protein